MVFICMDEYPYIYDILNSNILLKGGKMATAKKVACAAKTKEGNKCKNSASGKSKFCAAHKKK